MTRSRWLLFTGLVLLVTVFYMTIKSNELYYARVETDSLETERKEYIKEINKEYGEGEEIILNNFKAEDKEHLVERLVRDGKPKTIRDNWQVKPDETEKVFVYQPTGGWGNQRMILKNAIAAANAMNRVLILPMISPRECTSEVFVAKATLDGFLWRGYERFKAHEMSNMVEILDVAEIRKVVKKGVRVHNGTLTELKEIWSHKKWMVYEKPRHKNGKFLFFSDKYIRSHWGNRREDVVFWNRNSMFMCCGPSNIYSANIGFNLYLRAVAHKLIQSTTNLAGFHNAIHVRRGGGHTSFDRRTPQRFYKEHLRGFNKTIPLYIATDENDLSWFKPFVNDFGFRKLIFWRDLPDDVKEKTLMQYPATMRNDVTGFIEQLICAKAKRFAGSHGSTFSAAIMAFRRNKKLRAINIATG